MRGDDVFQDELFSYGGLGERVPAKHPLRRLRAFADSALETMSSDFEGLYSKIGRPSIAPEQLLRALLWQMLYSVRSERMLVEQLEYNLLFRWFVGLPLSEHAWDATSFTKNRERLLEGEVAQCRRTRLASGDAGSTRGSTTGPSTPPDRRSASGSNASSAGSKLPLKCARHVTGDTEN
jgi:transposase